MATNVLPLDLRIELAVLAFKRKNIVFNDNGTDWKFTANSASLLDIKKYFNFFISIIKNASVSVNTDVTSKLNKTEERVLVRSKYKNICGAFEPKSKEDSLTRAALMKDRWNDYKNITSRKEE